MPRTTPALPTFNVIYADPPWQFKPYSQRPLRLSAADRPRAGRTTPYPTMTTAEICALPVPLICERDAVLFLWAIYPMLPDALQVIDAWGFTYITVAFTWVKTNPSGQGFHFGLGFWTRANPEICLLATRGHPSRVSRSIPNLVIAPRREHSRKPDIVRERIVTLVGDLPRIELFAREKAPGWRVWGNEVASDLEFPQPAIPSR